MKPKNLPNQMVQKQDKLFQTLNVWGRLNSSNMSTQKNDALREQALLSQVKKNRLELKNKSRNKRFINEETIMACHNSQQIVQVNEERSKSLNKTRFFFIWEYLRAWASLITDWKSVILTSKRSPGYSIRDPQRRKPLKNGLLNKFWASAIYNYGNRKNCADYCKVT